MQKPSENKHKKSLGQHFLHEAGVITDILEAVENKTGETIVEIGPGGGALTGGLIKLTRAHGGKLICLELDHDRIAPLRAEFEDAQIEEIDATTADFNALVPKDRDWVFVSNLPYNVGTAILMNALTCSHPPRRLVIMVQREVGERILAVVPNMSLLSIAVQLYASVKRIRLVKPGSFTPPPKVDSIVLSLDMYPEVSPERIIKLAKAGFTHPRKILRKNLSVAGYNEQNIDAFLRGKNLKPTVRAQELSVKDWEELSAVV